MFEYLDRERLLLCFLGLLDLERYDRLRVFERDLRRFERERLLERDDRDLERVLCSDFLSFRALYDGGSVERDRCRSRDLVNSRDAGRRDFSFESCFLSCVLLGDRKFPFCFPSESSSSPKDVMNFIPPSTGEGERDREPDSALRYWPYVGLSRAA